MLRKAFVITAVVVFAVALGMPSAYADQITLGDSCLGSLTVTGTGIPSVSGTVSRCMASWEQSTPPPTGINEVIGTWGLSGGTALTVTGKKKSPFSKWFLDGTVTWDSFFNGGTCGAAICGGVDVSSVSGFNNQFVVGHTYFIDLAFKPRNRKTSKRIVSSGEVVTPEPATLTLLGTGLLAMAGFFRRKLHKI